MILPPAEAGIYHIGIMCSCYFLDDIAFSNATRFDNGRVWGQILMLDCGNLVNQRCCMRSRPSLSPRACGEPRTSINKIGIVARTDCKIPRPPQIRSTIHSIQRTVGGKRSQLLPMQPPLLSVVYPERHRFCL